MAKPLIDDDLWGLVEPLIPETKRRFFRPGRKPIPPRRIQTGIVFVLVTGIPWEKLPQEMGCGSGMSCWRRLQEWQEAGVWQRIYEVLLAKLRQADCLDLSRVPVDSSSVRAVGAGEKNRPQSHRSRPARHQAPRRNRRERRAAGGACDGRQRQ
jgi:transposase